MLHHYYKIILFILLISFNKIGAQTLKGIVVDEDKLPLEFVSVALLQPKDSLLVKYTSTDVNGKFEITDIKKERYLLQIYLMTYQAQQTTITIETNNIKLDTIVLNREVNSLDEVVISAFVPIKIKQDTVAFNTKAFKVRQDDNVGELIKKLPGIEVETDGTVIAQGQTVTKILVDGKEFFNNDPTIALQNLSADAIESIEIIEESSDDSRVSGIKDGEKNKVINLVLKPGKKFGYFGKAGAGYGTNDRYATNFDVNSFTKKTQFAVFGNLNNINNTGASIFQRDGTKDRNDSGFLTTGTAGVNYNYEFKPDFNLNVDYYYNYTDNKQESLANRTEFTSNDSFDSQIKNESESVSNNHNASFSLRDRSKKDAYLAFRGNFKSDDRSTDNINSTVYFDDIGKEDTSTDRITRSNDDRKNGWLNASYRKKLDKSGRNFRISSGISYVDFFDTNYQLSLNKYNISNPSAYYESKEIITQEDTNDAIKYNLNVRYTEPIFKNNYINFTSTINNENRAIGLYEIKIIDDLEQTPFEYLQNYFGQQYNNQLGYLYSNKKLQINAEASYDVDKQNLTLDEELIVRNVYKNLLPKISVNYEYEKGKRLRFQYYKSVVLPSIKQLSPIVNDFNPRRISFGNPDLTPSKVNTLNLRYYTHSYKSANNFYTYFAYVKSSNAIVSKIYYDENRIRYSTFENYGNTSKLNGSVNFSRKISKINVRYSIKLDANMFDRTAIIDNDYNETKSKGTGAGLSFSNINKNVFDITVGAKFNVNKTEYSFQETNNYFEQNYFGKFDWDITNSFNFNSQFDYTMYADSNFDSQSIPIWNMAVEYVFMKQKRGNLKLQVFDVLNKDVGVDIRSDADSYEEIFRKNIGMYAMLSFSYSLKPPTHKESKKEEGRGSKRDH